MKTPRGFKGKYFSLAAILALSTTITLANEAKSFSDTQKVTQTQEEYSEDEELTLPEGEEIPVAIISKKIKVKESDATFASEVYTKRQLENSKSKDIYEFLNTQSSVTLLPSYGDTFSPNIDMRGYGIGNGYENVVISVNGRRLNNIDMSPQLLSSIPFESIEKIEIIKGSGSVEYGDGSNAGAINIITKGYEGINLKSYIGSNGLEFISFGAGIEEDKFSLSGSIDDYSHDGHKVIVNDGTKDESWSRNKEIQGTFSPIDSLTFNLGKSFSKNHLKYPSALSLEEYKQNPHMIPDPMNYTKRNYDSDVLTYGLEYSIDKYKFDFQMSDEDKVSDWGNSSAQSRYEYKNYDTKFSYDTKKLKALFGFQKFEGQREGTSNLTTKDNIGYYGKLDYLFKDSTLSLGARGEKVEYVYSEVGTILEDDYTLSAFDIGYNYKIDKISSLFLSMNKSFQAPNIDRFFKPIYDMFWNYDHTEFNSFIKPMKVKTFNMGYNYLGYPNKLKISTFFSMIEDEIYYDGANNTNLDKTQKYGFEIYDKYNIKYNLFTTLNYSYVDTEIKKESTNPNIEGRGIPGVSNHNIKIGVGYNPTHRINLLLTHIHKSKAYAMSDFDGNYGKMEAYNTTNFSASYKYKNYEVFAKVNNLFDKQNALFADSGFSLGVYPVNYERNFLVGFKARF